MITRVCYVTREEVKAALDIKTSAHIDARVDRIIEGATEAVEGQLHRRFYPELATRYVDWPNYQHAYPWRVWLEENELADYTTAVLASGGVTIDALQVFYEPINTGPPYEYFELNRAGNATFGNGPTPQRDISLQGPFGYWMRTTAAGQLAAAMADTTSTMCMVTNSAAVGVGDSLLVDAERLLVCDKAMADTGGARAGQGCATANLADNALTPSAGTLYVGETVLLGTERMLVLDAAGGTYTVQRAYDGTVLATHAGAEIYAPRLLTVERATLGTTAAAHLNAAVVSRGLYPGLVKNLALAEAVVEIKREPAAFALSQGSGPAKQTGIGDNLEDLRAQCYTRYGRKARIGAV